MPVDYVSIAYATTIAVGGAVGYAKAGSIGSLAAGLLFGGLMGFGVYQTSQDPSNYYLSFGTSAALGTVMGMRFFNSGKFMPAGLITLLSLMMVGRFTMRALAPYRK